MARFLLAVSLLLLAGCAASEKGPTDGETVGDPGEQNSTDPGNPLSPSSPAPSAPFDRFSLTDCLGAGAIFVWPTAVPSNGPEVPPGWEPSGRLVKDYRVDVMECQRVSAGPFERGPVRFLFEHHTHITAPPDCLQDSENVFEVRVFASAWFDDAELVQSLDENLSLPMVLGEFEAQTETNQIEVHTWSWRAPGGETSSLRFSKTDDHSGGNPELVRYFWHNGTAVSYMDLLEDTKQPLYNAPAALGDFREPMLAAGTVFQTQPGGFSLFDPGDFTGEIHRFGDLECKHPL